MHLILLLKETPAMIIATWSAIFLAALSIFWFQARRLGLLLLLAGYGGALWSGMLTPAALPWLLLLLLAGWAARLTSNRLLSSHSQSCVGILGSQPTNPSDQAMLMQMTLVSRV
jgi:hypothetical protein